jgi:hypothetical protein
VEVALGLSLGIWLTIAGHIRPFNVVLTLEALKTAANVRIKSRIVCEALNGMRAFSFSVFPK